MKEREPAGLILVAGTKPAVGQHAGGVLTATTLLMKSGFSSHFKIYPIDSTSVSYPPESIPFKVRKGLYRLWQFLGICIRKRPKAALLWASRGFSLYEKLFLCLLCRIFGIRSAMLFPDSLYMDRIESSAWRRKLHRYLFSIPNVLVCRSRTWVDRYVALGLAPERCVIVKNWIDLDKYVACRRPQPKGSDIVFLFVGWLNKEKGTQELVEAIRLVLPRLPKSKWILVGGGKEEERVRAFVKAQGLDANVEIAGWKEPEQLVDYYKQADVLVLPSHGEGFPYAIIEAMSAGLPVITTPVGGIPGIFLDGEHGLFVPPRDAGKLAEAMLRIAEDWAFRQRVSETVTTYVETNHDINTVWPDLARILEGTTDSNGSHISHDTESATTRSSHIHDIRRS